MFSEARQSKISLVKSMVGMIGVSLANHRSVEGDPVSHSANPISRSCGASRALLLWQSWEDSYPCGYENGTRQEVEAIPLATIGFSQALEEFNERNYGILMDVLEPLACCALSLSQE